MGMYALYRKDAGGFALIRQLQSEPGKVIERRGILGELGQCTEHFVLGDADDVLLDMHDKLLAEGFECCPFDDMEFLQITFLKHEDDDNSQAAEDHIVELLCNLGLGTVVDVVHRGGLLEIDFMVFDHDFAKQVLRREMLKPAFRAKAGLDRCWDFAFSECWDGAPREPIFPPHQGRPPPVPNTLDHLFA